MAYIRKKSVLDQIMAVSEDCGISRGGIARYSCSFKFLGTFISNDLNWTTNCTSILKKAKQRIYFLRLLKTYNVSRSILFNFYQAIIQSILSSSILVWYGAATQQDLYKLNSVVKYCEKIVNLRLPSLENIYFERLEKKTNLILKDEYHPSRKYFNFFTKWASY